MHGSAVFSLDLANFIRHEPNLAVERTSASSSAVYSDGWRGWPKPLSLKRWAAELDHECDWKTHSERS